MTIITAADGTNYDVGEFKGWVEAQIAVGGLSIDEMMKINSPAECNAQMYYGDAVDQLDQDHEQQALKSIKDGAEKVEKYLSDPDFKEKDLADSEFEGMNAEFVKSFIIPGAIGAIAKLKMRRAKIEEQLKSARMQLVQAQGAAGEAAENYKDCVRTIPSMDLAVHSQNLMNARSADLAKAMYVVGKIEGALDENTLWIKHYQPFADAQAAIMESKK